MEKRQIGFTLIEMAIALVIMGVILSGAMTLASSAIQSRQTSSLNSAVTAAKSAAVLAAINAREIEEVCVAGPAGCATSATCAGQCAVYSSKYPVPDLVTVGEDPWGRPLTYTPIALEVNSLTLPTDPIFEVASDGPDGASDTGDEFVHEVTGEEFISIVIKSGLGG